MTIENDFLVWAGAGGANVLTQAAYAALGNLTTGVVSGTASSAQANKAWRQASIIAAMIAQFITDKSGQTAIDDGTTATLETNFTAAINAVMATNSPSLLNTNGWKKIPDAGSPSGFWIIQWGTTAVGAPTTVNFPIAFPNAALRVVVSESNANSGTWGAGNPTVHGAATLSTSSYVGWALGWQGSSWVAGTIGQAFIAIGY